MRYVIVLLAISVLPGCVVRTAANVATAPVRAAGWSYDRLTTSQSEADRARGERDRKEEARDAKAARKAARKQERAERDR
jgi:hypothetical protein